jgi:hypothetical protein
VASKKRYKAVEGAVKQLKMPKEWPALAKVFSNCNLLKTSEQLLYCGPVGAYCFQFLDVDEAIKKDMIGLLTLMEVAMRKSSTPGDRARLRRELAPTVTRLELCLPLYYQTMVMHYLVFHTLGQLEATGPFHVANQLNLDMERFQVVLKGCAQGKKHVMTSILNNFLLLEVSLNNRLTSTFDWTVKPMGSSTATYIQQQATSLDKTDRMWACKGKSTQKLDPTVFSELTAIWQLHEPTYDALCLRFQRRQAEHRGAHRRAMRAVSFAEWNPKPRLTAIEMRWTHMRPLILVHTITAA